MTSKTEIADILGYANHSAASKRLAQIRRAAVEHFDENRSASREFRASAGRVGLDYFTLGGRTTSPAVTATERSRD
ncbi:hypothetical protein LCL61_00005 [Amycolatopsis coloradensis]|uniref:Uncharacterized protein n=1 Tax=Amycolatopsis coloradensis TaxID=76021 RepID=A0ACD5B3Q0_9PSEU